jgi:hypothetical protein
MDSGRVFVFQCPRRKAKKMRIKIRLIRKIVQVYAVFLEDSFKCRTPRSSISPVYSH